MNGNSAWSRIAMVVAIIAVILAVVAIVLILVQEKAPQMKVWTKTIALKNAGVNAPADWEADYPGIFTEVYSAFAVLQGFSLYNNNGNTSFNSWGHDIGSGYWTAHTYARVIGYDNTKVWGQVYCQEANTNVEADNTVLLTVVVIGRS